METTDLTTRVLIEIRAEAKRTNEHVDHLETRFDQLEERLDWRIV